MDFEENMEDFLFMLDFPDELDKFMWIRTGRGVSQMERLDEYNWIFN